MVSNSISDVINVLISHNYSKDEINFILDRRKLYDIDNFYIKNNSSILYSEDSTLFYNTLITFDKNDVINFTYNYFSLITCSFKTILYIRNEYGFLEEIINNETIIKKDLMNYLSYSYTITKTSFLNADIVYKYYVNENICNSKTIEKLTKNNKQISLSPVYNSDIKPDIKYIFSAERNLNEPNLFNWKYIENSECLTGQSLCFFGNDLQNLMNDSIYDSINENKCNKILNRKK